MLRCADIVIVWWGEEIPCDAHPDQFPSACPQLSGGHREWNTGCHYILYAYGMCNLVHTIVGFSVTQLFLRLLWTVLSIIIPKSLCNE